MRNNIFQKGFTLIEILIVVSIISVLSAAVVPQIDSSFNKAKESGVMVDFRTFEQSAQLYLRDIAGQNITREGFNSYIDSTHEIVANGTLLRTSSLDPWGQPYEVVFSNEKIVFKSYGKSETASVSDYLLATYYQSGVINSCTTGFSSNNMKIEKLVVSGSFECGDHLTGTPPSSTFPAPTGFSVSSAATRVELRWNAVTNATGYTLRRDGVSIYSGAATAFADTTVNPNTTYNYSLVAHNGAQTSSVTSLTVTTPTAVSATPSPATPTNLRNTSVTEASITMAWNASASATSYQLSRNGVQIYSGSNLSFADNGLIPNTDYTYSLIAVNSGGNSSATTVTVRTKLINEGEGSTTNPYVIYNVNQLQRMNQCLTCHYILGSNIDATASSSWNGGLGFIPIENSSLSSHFVGSLDGQNYVINNLSINRPTEDWVGLFDTVDDGATVQNITFTAANVVGNNNVGVLAGNVRETATIQNIDSSGTVTGNDYVGGIIGYNASNTTTLDSVATVNGNVGIGGVIGENAGEVRDVNSTAIVTANNMGGAIIGRNLIGATLNTAKVDAPATIGGGTRLGGVIGLNEGQVISIRSEATINGTNYVGGVAGENTGSIGSAVMHGDVYGSIDVGGIVGANLGTGTITNSQTTYFASIYADYSIGGIVGYNIGLLDDVDGSAYIEASEDVGGVVGYNEGEIYNSIGTGEVIAYLNTGGISGTNAGYMEYLVFDGGVFGGENSGGIAGANPGRIYTAKTLSGVSGTTNTGGVVGINSGRIENSYGAGAVSGSSYVGGLIGFHRNTAAVVNSYSRGRVEGTNRGGMIGTKSSTATVTSSYYDSTVTGLSDTGKGAPRTTTQMKTQSTYVGWNFTSVWAINATVDSGYPTLR